MTLLFGNLTQSFIAFGSVIASAQSGNPDDVQMVPQAAAALRKDAAKNATYLILVGEMTCVFDTCQPILLSS
jgi:ATP-binding cassette, subfamily B (MDR/TAP), member 1